MSGDQGGGQVGVDPGTGVSPGDTGSASLGPIVRFGDADGRSPSASTTWSGTPQAKGGTVGALVGARSCGRCGQPLGSGATWCFWCGVRIVSAATGSAIGTYSGLLAGVQTATPSRRRSAVAIDWGVPLLLLGVLVVGVVTGASSATPGAALVPVPVEVAVVVVALAFVALDVVLYVRGGRSVGRLLLSLRTVDDLTGRPPAVLRVDRRGRFSIRRQAVTVDLRRGRDPMTSSPPLVQRPALPAAASAPLPPHPTDPLDAAGRPDENTFGRTGQGRPTTAAPSIVLELDSGERLDLETTLLIGRAPVNREGEEHPVFAWADLARSLTKTHALFAWEGAVLWVTDLGSTNGSSLVAPDGTRQPLVAGLRGPAAPGYVVELGERTLTVQPSGVVDA
jgi:hypothetical protein